MTLYGPSGIIERKPQRGPEAAAIFAIFTSQVWNMILSFYQSCKTVPYDLKEATAMLQLSPWQKFWRLEVPFAMPGLIWNAMMSMSASWFFVVASEAIITTNHNIKLPGIGSSIGMALPQEELRAVGYAILPVWLNQTQMLSTIKDCPIV